ncbi:S1 family peptidase [Rheinheimera sp. NSM]|uniref:S1 family peptidase n=1 Tax=Rheinheimera sp. NSM TaxID=3457884 RepID=UPI004036DDA1
MYKVLLCLLALYYPLPVWANLSNSIEQIKPAVVALGIYSPLASPRIKLIGSGFAVPPGNQIVTNYHVISRPLSTQRNESYVVLSGSADNVNVHQIISTKQQPEHDLAVLKIKTKLPAVTLGDAKLIAEGTEIAFTGFPITAVLGLYPATHRGIISAVTPIAIPADNSAQLQASALRQLRKPFMVYQLDATAYPGNSGSPLFDIETAQVIGIINQVYVKSTREAVLRDPSAISFAIPVSLLLPLLDN